MVCGFIYREELYDIIPSCCPEARLAAAMKFGKDLQQYKLPGWEDDYLDYKGLKYILKKLEEGVPREEVDGEFFQALEDDLEKARRPRPCWPGLSSTTARR